MKSVIFRIGTLESGGAERVLINLIRNMDRNKYAITLLSETGGGALESTVPSDVKKIFLFRGNKVLPGLFFIALFYKVYRKLSIGLIRTWPDLLYFFKIITRHDIDVTCVQDLVPYTQSKLFDDTKRIAWIHTDLKRQDYSKLLRKKIIQGLYHYNSIIAVSEQVKSTLLELNPEISNKVTVVPNIVMKNEIYTKAGEPIDFERSLETTLIFIGRLEKVKGVDRLLSCCKKLTVEGFIFKLIIVGDGAERNHLEYIIKQLELTEIVSVMGFKANPYPYLKAADIFVLSSYAEGYPMVVTEAMVLGKAILATKVSGIKEILNSGEYGLVVENDEQSLYEGLKILLSDPLLRNSLKSKAVEGSHNFNIESIISKIDQIFLG